MTVELNVGIIDKKSIRYSVRFDGRTDVVGDAWLIEDKSGKVMQVIDIPLEGSTTGKHRKVTISIEDHDGRS